MFVLVLNTPLNFAFGFLTCGNRKGVLKNFAKFTGKHLCQSLFFIKLQAD